MSKPIKIANWQGERCTYATAKLDGNWCTLINHGDLRGMRAYTSLPTDITDKVEHYDWFRRAATALSPGQELWGEVWVPGRPASDVKTWYASTKLTVFAVPHLGVECPLEDVHQWCELSGLEFTPFLRWDPNDEYWTEEVLLDVAKSAGYEGWVLKHCHLAYWYKLKAVHTADLRVVGFVPGQGKYSGMVGSITVADADGREVADVSGFNDDERAAIGPSDVGRIAEVAYQYIGSRGKLRHPRFVRWRDDKDAEDLIEVPKRTDEEACNGSEY